MAGEKVKATIAKILVERVAERRNDILAGKAVAPWKKTWKGASGRPQNLISGKAYRGVNVIMTSFVPWESPFWVTRKQMKEMGAKVRQTTTETFYGPFLPTEGVEIERKLTKSEKGYTPIVFWLFPNEEQKSQGKKFAMCRFYQVWNIDQLHGGRLHEHKRVQEWTGAQTTDKGRELFDIETAERIIKSYVSPPTTKQGGGRAYYVPMKDHVQMPPRKNFVNDQEWYSTLFHELGHSTGHHSRLARDGVVNHAAFGDHRYSQEELVAEIAATMLCSEAGIAETAIIDNSAAYLDSWLKKIQADPELLYSAGAQAQKAVDHILGVTFEKKEAVAA